MEMEIAYIPEVRITEVDRPKGIFEEISSEKQETIAQLSSEEYEQA